MSSSPTKPFAGSSLGLKTYIISQAALVLTVLLLLILPAKADDWQISQDENYISLSKNGEIQHGNKIYYNFDKQNGCKFNVFFFIYTMQDDIPNPLSEIYEDKSIDLIFGGSPLPALLNYSTEFGLGQIAGIYVTRDVPLSQYFVDVTEDMLQDNLMMMQITGEHLQYFDIPKEQWDFTNIKNYLNQAHSMCVAHII